MTTNHYRLSIANVITARKSISDIFKNTPQFISKELSDLFQLKLIIKNETLNPVGSFKGRSAELFVRGAQPNQQFFCASAGNFGQAMAYCCREKMLKLIVYASVTANSYKIERMKKMGAEVVSSGKDFDAAKIAAKNKAHAFHGRFIEDSQDIESLEGAATIGLELLEFSEKIDVILIALGNGALVNGIARVIKHYQPGTQIIAVQSRGASAMVDSWRSSTIISSPSTNTIADGIAVRIPIPQALTDMQGLVDKAILVQDKSILQAMELIYCQTEIIPEPSAAVGIAAILENPILFKGKTVATVICGGNLTSAQKEEWLKIKI